MNPDSAVALGGYDGGQVTSRVCAWGPQPYYSYSTRVLWPSWVVVRIEWARALHFLFLLGSAWFCLWH